MEKILVINPGSTSTKIAVYENEKQVFLKSIEHLSEEIQKYDAVIDQYSMRKELILSVLRENGIEVNSITAIVARGGLLPPLEAGAYRVNDDMVEQLKYHPQNEHVSNLAAVIANEIATKENIPAYIYDPVTVDELIPVVRITGLVEMQRKSLGHNLNMRAAAMQYSKEAGKPYETLNLVVVHLGGGITLTLHSGGRMIDMVSDEEGPFSPERAGGLPIFQLIKMATSDEYDFKSMMKKVKSQGGLLAHCGTTDARKLEKMIVDGDDHAALVYDAMALNISKNIAKLAVVVEGKVDAIILTGGIAFSKMLTSAISKRVEFIAPVVLIPGEHEMEALALGALRVQRGTEKAKTFVKDF